MLLKELTATYIKERNSERPIGRELAAKTCSHYFECVRAFEVWLGRPAEIDDLTPEAINRFLSAIIAKGLSAFTANNRRAGLRKLVRFARQKKFSKAKSRDIRPVPLPQLDTDGYTAEEMRLLIEQASLMKFTIRDTKIPKALFWCSLIPVKWEVGLRIGDFTRVRLTDFQDGVLTVFEQKTAKRSRHRLKPSTAAAIAACIAADPSRELIWDGLHPKSICKAFTRIAVDAGLPG